MKTCQQAAQLFHEELFPDHFAGPIDTVADARRRATLVFDMLLSCLTAAPAGDQPSGLELADV